MHAVLAGMGTDAPADAGEGVGLAGDAVGLLPAALGGEGDVPLRRGVHRAGRGARSPAAVVDRERRPAPRWRRAGRSPCAWSTPRSNSLSSSTGQAAAQAPQPTHWLADEAGQVAHPHPELAGWPAHRGHLGEGVDVDARRRWRRWRAAGRASTWRSPRSGRSWRGAPCSRPGTAPSRPDGPRSRRRQAPRPREPADAAAHHQRRAMQEGARGRQVGRCARRGRPPRRAPSRPSAAPAPARAGG